MLAKLVFTNVYFVYIYYYINCFVFSKAFVVRFLTKRYIIEYDHGTDNKYRHEMLVENEPVIFDIIDYSSQSSINNLDLNSHSPDLILLVYSITDRQSFNFIRNFLKKLAQIKGNIVEKNTDLKIMNILLLALSTNHIPLVAIVGNKSDLVHLR